MPLGKDSITKRVAKPAEEQKKAPATKKAAAKKPAAKPAVKASVLSAVAPETVEKVVAHKENAPVEKCALGQALPYYLL